MAHKHDFDGQFFGKIPRHKVDLFLGLNLQISVLEFMAKWNIDNYSQIGEILEVEPAQISRWLSSNSKHNISQHYLIKLAIADLFFEFYENIPQDILAKYLD
jgi:transcriptional regulator with XRE-family HTH domain